MRIPSVDIIFSAIYCELLHEGTTPVAWATTLDGVNIRDMLNVALKSISLMSFDDVDGQAPEQPRAIVDGKDAFGIIPYPDQDSISIVYLFEYTRAGETPEKITATLSLLARTGDRGRLIAMHEPVKQLMKYHAYEILKVVVDQAVSDPRPAITALLETLLAKVNRLATTRPA